MFYNVVLVSAVQQSESVIYIHFILDSNLMRRVDSLEKTLMLGGIGGRRREEKGTTEDEMAGWHHRLDGR